MLRISISHCKRKISKNISFPFSTSHLFSRSPFPIPHSLFSVFPFHYLFFIPHSSFNILHLPFLIFHSSFIIPYSSFSIFYILFPLPRSSLPFSNFSNIRLHEVLNYRDLTSFGRFFNRHLLVSRCGYSFN